MRAIILCGGSGTRLWPESRESLPKQFISLFDDKTLLDLTVERVSKIKWKKKPIFICNEKHVYLVRTTLHKYDIDAYIFLEPERKNTCCAIYLAAKYCSPEDKLLIMPSDHFIPNSEKFINAINKISDNLNPNYWITMGVKPIKPSEAYGYIKVDKNSYKIFYKVESFIEKPSKKLAIKLIKDENCFWNAGIFIANANKIINSTKKYAPEIAFQCDKVFKKISLNKLKNEISFSSKLFSQIPNQSIDYAILEHEEKILLYPFNHDWNDIGSWDALAEIDNKKPVVNRFVQINSKNNYIKSDKRVIATIDVNDLIIIDNDNCTLISKKGSSEKVKLAVNKLVEQKIFEAKEHSFEYRPWGKFENILISEEFKIKKVTVNPNSRLSKQYHNFRNEHWFVVEGKAIVFQDGEKKKLKKGQSIDIPKKSIHYIHNYTQNILIFIEIQTGKYLGEDDIIRIEDIYERK